MIGKFNHKFRAILGTLQKEKGKDSQNYWLDSRSYVDYIAGIWTHTAQREALTCCSENKTNRRPHAVLSREKIRNRVSGTYRAFGNSSLKSLELEYEEAIKKGVNSLRR
jgi:hypothetical protein